MATSRHDDAGNDAATQPAPARAGSTHDGRTNSTVDLVGPFVGRQRELDIVDEAMSQGRSVIVVGSRGTGRTRLLAECATRRQRAPHWIRGMQGLRTIPLGAVHAAFGREPADAIGPADVSDTIAELCTSERLLVVDDIEFLDDTTASVLRALQVRHGIQLLMAGSSEQTPPADLLAAWHDGSCWRVDLAPLSVDEVAEMVAGLVGAAVTDATSRRIWAVTLGNPLYVRELAHEGVELERFERSDDGLVWRGPMGRGRRVHDVVMSRIGGLSANQLRTLHGLAVAAPVSWPVALRLGSADDLNELAARNLIAVDDLVELASPLLQTALVDAMGVPERRRWARQLAELFAHQPIRSRLDTVRMARWALEARSADVDMLVDAAAAGLALHDLSAAQAFIDEAVRLEPERASVRSMASRVWEAVGRHDDVTHVLGDGVLGDSALDDAAARLDWAMRYSTNAVLAGTARDDAVRLLASLPVPVGHVGEPEATAAWIELFEGNVAAAGAAAHAVLDDPDSSLTALIWSAFAGSIAGSMHGDVARADLDLAVGRALLPRADASLPFARMQLGIAAITVNVMAGRWAQAVRMQPDVTATGDDAEHAMVLAAWTGFRAFAAKEAGDLVAAKAMLVDLLHIVADADPFQLRALACSELAACASVLGDTAAAKRALAQFDAAQPGLPLFQPLCLRNRAWVGAARGDQHGAGALLDQARELARSNGQSVIEAMVHLDAARLTRRRPGADDRRRLGASDHPAQRMFIDAATALGDGDAEACLRSARHFEQAGSHFLANELAVAALVADPRRLRLVTDAMIAEPSSWLTPLRQRAAETVEPLTTREAEVARLAAAGGSSADIAAEYGVSVRTVDNQLGHVYRKLGLAGRKELISRHRGALRDVERHE
jgi:DNA-binding CsgD family transcriptional regulator